MLERSERLGGLPFGASGGDEATIGRLSAWAAAPAAGFPGGSVFAAPILSGLIARKVADTSVSIGRRAGISPKPKASASRLWKLGREKQGLCPYLIAPE